MVTHGDINEGDARPVVAVRLVSVNKRVLTPVADHQAKAHDRQRQYEDEDGSPPVELPHGVLQRIAAELPERRLAREERPVLADEVAWEVEPYKEVEPPNVVQEVPDVVTLVSDGGRLVVGAVALDVMMFNMVAIGLKGQYVWYDTGTASVLWENSPGLLTRSMSSKYGP